MALSDHLTRTVKQRGIITTVDPSQKVIEVVTKAGPTHVALWSIPNGFVWPKEGQEWSIYEQNGFWYLGERFLNQEEEARLTSLSPGQRFFGDDEIDQLKDLLGLA